VHVRQLTVVRRSWTFRGAARYKSQVVLWKYICKATKRTQANYDHRRNCYESHFSEFVLIKPVSILTVLLRSFLHSALTLISISVACRPFHHHASSEFYFLALCWPRGWNNWPTPFLGRMSYKATKTGSVCPLSYRRFFECVSCCLLGPLFVLCYFESWLVWLSCQYWPSDAFLW